MGKGGGELICFQEINQFSFFSGSIKSLNCLRGLFYNNIFEVFIFMSDEKVTRSLEHAWKYFELHAQQRMTVFNFFLAISGLVAAGIGAGLQQGGKFSVLVCLLGCFLFFIAFLFWKLDQRVSLMIKASEDAIIAIEKAAVIKEASIFSNEQPLSRSFGVAKVWSYGRCFRTCFCLVALSGLFFVFAPYFMNMACSP